MTSDTFDEAIERAVRAVEAAGSLASGCEATLIRDVQGRLRLHVIFPDDGLPDEVARERIEMAFKNSTAYATDTVFLERRRDFEKSPLNPTIKKDRKPLPLKLTSVKQPDIWGILERRLSKDSWIDEPVTIEPWSLQDDAPPVLSFYSFKGGVGRTTALTALALYLAEVRSLHVLVLDLDLEAPGIGTLLLHPVDELGLPRDSAQALPELGAIDLLIEERVHPGRIALSRAMALSPLITGRGKLSVMPAGDVASPNYLEKLGRLDLQGPPLDGLRALLHKLLHRIRQEIRPNVILLDVRAGLADLGGIALSGLAHYELLFGLHTEQSWQGLRPVVRHLGRLRLKEMQQEQKLSVKLVHGMVPPEARGGKELREAFLHRAYELFCDEEDGFYLDPDDLPVKDAKNQPHYPLILPFREGLLALSDLHIAAKLLLSDEHRVFCEEVTRWIGKD